ncbi:MAG: 2-C-methyl-D-erythritol 4-phosphate cytidylyltransferase [Anaerohalosphaeraceae bacterium]|nr:2-C-methyl-D-erythritol 4-phosphate cytidylyltransferase [Anaerohalosphaeraceae bacterium]
MNIAVIICAAGAGTRFGSKRKKQFTDVAGRPAFLRSVEFFADNDDVKQILLSIPAEDAEIIEITHGAKLAFHGAKLCTGGSERFETVAKTLSLVKNDIDIIAIHDAVRCCLTEKWVRDVFALAVKTGAAMLAAPVVATLKKVADSKIIETIDRTNLYEAQTPQVFKADLLREAYGKIDTLDKSKISDDSQLIEAMGKKVSIVETDSSNIKITTACDVAIAEAIIKTRQKEKPKGYVGPYNDAAKW